MGLLQATRPERVDQNLDVANIDNTMRRAKVILTTNRRMGTIGHWLAIFQFSETELCICEETAVDSQGVRYGGNDWVFRTVAGTVEDYLERDGGALQVRHRMEHEEIVVETSAAEILHKCKTNPMNYIQYDINSDNCQRWLKVLLVEGLGVDTKKLPTRWGQVFNLLSFGAFSRASKCVPVF